MSQYDPKRSLVPLNSFERRRPIAVVALNSAKGRWACLTVAIRHIAALARFTYAQAEERFVSFRAW